MRGFLFFLGEKGKTKLDDFEKLQGFIWMVVDPKFLPRVCSLGEEESLLNERWEEC